MRMESVLGILSPCNIVWDFADVLFPEGGVCREGRRLELRFPVLCTPE